MVDVTQTLQSMMNLFKWKLLLATTVLMVISLANSWVVETTKYQIFEDMTTLPSNDVGIVLGTSKRATYGTNLYFKYRMQAAADLYHAGKIKHILVSGDNHTHGYDEPTDMKNYLVGLGVPATAITCDFAGFRTLDSMVRCKEIFGVSTVTVISQGFHNQRALFIANNKGLYAVGYNARAVYKNTPVREYFARVAAWLDVFVWNRQPKFLGAKEPVTVEV